MASVSAKSLEEGTCKPQSQMTVAEETEWRLMNKTLDTFINSRFTVFVLRAFVVVLLVRIILDTMIEVFMLHGVVNNPAMKNGQMSITVGHNLR